MALLVALTAMAVTALGASAAKAAPFQATFDDAVLNLPAPAGNSDILDPPDTATITGDLTGTALTVDSPDFVFPPFEGTLSGIPLTVEFGALDDITGSVDASGNVTTSPSTYETLVGLGAPLNSDCTYQSDESFKTTAGTPFNGAAFTVNAGNPITITNGIVQTSWGAGHFSLVNSTGDCSLITNVINSGCGGLAMANGLTPTPSNCAPGGGAAPAPVTPVTKKKKKCKKAKKKKSGAEVAKKKKCKKKKKK